MSLKGLDAAPVHDAYSQCQNEAGGWFLLKYISRDEVELFRRGKNGVHEARNAIASYPDPSPLYGLIIYRRRKVLIKYIPEGTSRLLQARTAVHFQDVLERYSPYETLLEITTADALNDTTLAASFPLHTGSASILSNKLQEISEDAEDGAPQPQRSSSASSSATGSMFGTQRYKMEKRVDQIMRSDRPDRERYVPSMYAARDRLPGAPSSPTLSGTPGSSPIQKTSVSQFLVREDAGRRSVTSLSANSPRPSNSSPRMSPRTSPLTLAKSSLDPAQPISPIIPLGQSRSPELPSTQSMAQQSSVQNEDSKEEKKDPVEEKLSTQEPARERRSGSPVLPPTTITEETTKPDERELPDALTDETLPIPEKPKAEEDPYDFSHLFKPKVKLGPRVVTSTKRSSGPAVSSVPAPFKAGGRKQDVDQSKEEAPITPVEAASRGLGLRPPPIPNIPEYNPRPVSRGSVKSIPSQRSTASSADKTRLMRALELRKKKMQKVNAQQKISEPVQEDDAMQVELPPTIKEVPTPPLTDKPPTLDLKLADFGALKTKADSGISLDHALNEKKDDVRSADNVKVDSAIPEEPKEAVATEAPRDLAELSKAVENEPAPAIAAPSDVIPASSSPGVPKPIVAIDTGPSTAVVRRKAVETDANSTAHTSRTDIDRNPSKAPESDPDDSSDDDDDYTTPQSEAKDPIDQAEIIASLQKAASPVTTDTTVSPHVPSISSPRVDKDLPRPPRDSQDLETEPTMSPRLLEEITLGFLVPDNSAYEESYSRPSDIPGLGIKAPTLTISPTTMDTKEIREVSNPEAQPQSEATPPTVDEDDVPSDEDNEDDDMLEELHSATFEEATPISVTGSSLENALRKKSLVSLNSGHSVRSVNIRRVSSLQQDRDSASPSPSSPGEASGNFRSPSYTRNLTPPSVEVYEPSGPGGLRRNVSVGIVKRYESLAEATTKGVTPFYLSSDTRPLSPNAYDEFKGENDVEQRAPSRGPDDASPPASLKYPSSNALGLEKQSGAQQPQHGRVESMSISARIVKPDGVSADGGALQKSELVMNYKQAPNPQQPLPSPKAESIPSPTQASVHTMGSHGRKSASIDSGHKEGNMASRFFKRMSNLSNRRKSAASSPSMPQGETMSNADSMSVASRPETRGEIETPPAVVVGDLNIQFPDSLLWKRRIVAIDETGFVCFTNPSASEGNRNETAKKCHLREFKIPYTPDLERQELPFSIIMDFVDGSTPIQAACEDSLTHRQVLFILRTHWKAYAAI